MDAEWVRELARYREHLELEGLAVRTVSDRTRLVKKFADWATGIGIPGPATVTPAVLADYRRHRSQSVNSRGRRDGPFTVNCHLLALRDFFDLMAARGVSPAAIASELKSVRTPRLLPKDTPTHVEVTRLLEAVPLDTPIHVRDRAVIEALYSTGIRRQELCDLDVTDVDLDGGIVRIESGKGGRGRMVPIGRSAVEILRRYLAGARPALLGRAEDSGALFLSKSGKRLVGYSVGELVRRWVRAAGIEKRVTPHALRRSCATGMVRNRASLPHVKELLGHADYGSLQSYVKLEIVDLKEAHRKFHPREQSGAAPEQAPPSP